MATKINKDNYFLTGAVQAALIYYRVAFLNAARSVNVETIATSVNGFTTFYIEKTGSIRGKERWLSMSPEE